MESMLENLKNWKITELTRRCGQSEERLCKSIIKGLARRNRAKYAMLADVEEGQDVTCFDE